MTALPWERMRQPDQRSCGPSAIVAARMLLDPSYAEALGSAEDDGFAAEVLTTHRRATRPILAGRLQLPWPRALGTPPWAVARELSALSGPGVPARRHGWRLALFDPTAALERVLAGLDAGHPVALYVGNVWLPRHVVLAVGRATESAIWVYDPARGARVRVTHDSVTGRSLTLGRWDRLWFDVSPR